MVIVPRRLIFCGALALGAVATTSARSLDERDAAADSQRLEVVEDLSESLANDLLDLSVSTRDVDRARIRQFFKGQLSAKPFPSEPGPLQTELKWIAKREWTAPPGAPEAASSDQYLAGFFRFLEHFAEIEDARFKVKLATFEDSAGVVPDASEPTALPGSRGEATLKFFVQGRNGDDQREWARGVAAARFERGVELWQFTSVEIVSLHSMVATTDLFSEIALPAGVEFSRPAYGQPGNSGFVWHGAAAGDVDRDGWIDLFVTGTTRNFLYLNSGDGTFRDASESASVDVLASGVAPLLIDHDNDGDDDIFITAVGDQILLENRLVPDGELVFWDVSQEVRVAQPAVGFSATAADINADGRPDIYVASYNHYGRITPDSWFRATNGRPNLLFVSQPDGGYLEQAAAWQVADSRWSYAATFADVNEDGRPDLYVANDFGENALYVNSGDAFVDEGSERGVLDPGNGMGVSFGDYDNDGRLDLHVTNMSSTAGNRILSRLFPDAEPGENVLVKLASGNNLYKNEGSGRYRDVTAEAGGFSSGWAWGGGFIDFDNDGWEDIYTPNGFISGKSMKDT